MPVGVKKLFVVYLYGLPQGSGIKKPLQIL